MQSITKLSGLFLIPAILLSFFISSSAEDLTPLRYQNPGLHVDLGVGLWAFPLPCDFDNDGDMDLLVGCPDKPSNGIYFFENPGSPNVTMPVFKPGVRIAKATQDLQISYVNGKAHILRAAAEYVDFKANKFSEVKRIFPRTNVHSGKVRANQWRYVDWEADGDRDIIVGVGDWSDYGWDAAFDRQGRWKNGPLHGWIYLLLNNGSDTDPRYEKPKRIKANGADIDVYGRPSPNFADFDQDGDLDLLCGEFLDGFTYFENRGTRDKPLYSPGQRLKDPGGSAIAMDVQMVAPAAVDWDQDGDIDLVVGDEDGRVALVENTGALRHGMPVFSKPVYFQQEANELKCGALATPVAVDWDGDGDEDIISGDTGGFLTLFVNEGNQDGMPRWSAPQRLRAGGEIIRIQAGPNGGVQGPCEAKWGYTTLSSADWDGNGTPDLLVNSIWGQVLLFRNTGTRTKPELGPAETITLAGNSETVRQPKWNWWSPAENQLVTQWRTTPVAVDFDEDGLCDLVMLDSEGYLAFWKRTGDKSENAVLPGNRCFYTKEGALRLNARSAGGSGRIKLAVADWDGDGNKDILINSSNAAIYKAEPSQPSIDGSILVRLRPMGNLGERNVAGHTSSPAVCDFDGDNKPDLLVGAENGRIYHLRHDDCRTLPPTRPEVTSSPADDPVLSDQFIHDGKEFPWAHASTIAETSRGLVSAWFGGAEEGEPEVCILTSYHDGSGWSTPIRAADGIQHAGLRYPCWNPVLFQRPDGPLMLFYKIGPTPESWWGMLCISYDGGRSWREHRRLPEQILGPVRSKPVLLDDGTLLCGSSTEENGLDVHFERTSDWGNTWNRIGPIQHGDFSIIQPSILEHDGGRLQALCRSDQHVVVTTWSEDNGQTWTPAAATALPNPNAGIEALTLDNGQHWLVYNHGTRQGEYPSGRETLDIATSQDGLDWKKIFTVHSEASGVEFSYPAAIQTSDGMVHLTYTWKREKIRHVVFDPKKLLEAGGK